MTIAKLLTMLNNVRALLLTITIVVAIHLYHSEKQLHIERKLKSDQKPNILLLVLDQWRHDWDGLHLDTPNGPLPLQMPFLQSCAERGMRFTQAYVPSPLCAPVRACLASGKEYDHSGVSGNHADDLPFHTMTFYRLLRDKGNYHVMSCGKDDLFHGDSNFPFDPNEKYQDVMDLGFSDASRSAGKTRVTKENKDSGEPYRAYLLGSTMPLESGRNVSGMEAFTACHNGKTGIGTNCDATSFTSDIYPDDFVKNEAIALLDRAPLNKPWFLQVNFPGPHPPIMSTAKMAQSVRDRLWPLPIEGQEAYMAGCPQSKHDSFEPVSGERCNYAAQLENLDNLLEQIVNKVKDKGDLDVTVVCITGDHGEQLGDHGNSGKEMPWQSSISVPLICFGPNIPMGTVHSEPVSTLDLPGTFLDLASVGKTEPMTLESLLPVLLDDSVTPRRSFVSSGLDTWRLVVKESHGSSYKLICCDGECPGKPKNVPNLDKRHRWQVLLYNTKIDPYDTTPLVNNEIRDELVAHLPKGWCPPEQISQRR